MVKLFIAILMVSCSNKLDDEIKDEKIGSSDREVSYFLEIREQVFDQIRNDIKLVTDQKNDFRSDLSENFLREFDANIQKIDEIGIEQFYKEKDLDLSLLDKLEFYQENKDNPEVYDLLKENFVYKSEKEIEELFALIGLTKALQELHYIETGTYSSNWRCYANIGGALIATAGFAFVTGGWGLAIALAGKGYAMFSLIDSCISSKKQETKLEELYVEEDLEKKLKEGETLDIIDIKELIELKNGSK